MAKTYSEKLQDERWQKKRAEIIRRDNLSCVSCGACDTTLDVHHGYYEKDKEPWEYPNETLHTLCRKCHSNAENIRSQVYRELANWQPTALKSLLFYLYNSRDLKNVSEKLVWEDRDNG